MTSNTTYSGFVGMYNFKGNLGKGHYSVVKLAEHAITKDHVAIKIIEKAKLDKVELGHLHCEVRVMKLLRNPNVVRLYQVVDTPSRLFLILELGNGGDLFERIKERGKHNEVESRHIFEQLVKAIDYCHGCRVAHRDLKPENIVFCVDPVSGTEVVKITDFGLSNQSEAEETMMNTYCGSMLYSSPEVLLMEPYVGPMADIWSLGVMLYYIITAELPFQECTEHETVIKILEVDFECPAHVSESCAELVSKIMVKEPTDRLTGKEILRHPWVGATVIRRDKVADAAARIAAGATPSDGLDGGHVNKVLHEQVVSVLDSQAGITRKEIDEALEQKSYNYVASTYHLVAQQQIRRERGKKGRPASMAAGGAGLSASFSLPEDGIVSPMGIPHRASSGVHGDQDCRVREPASSGKKQGTLRRRVRPLDTTDPLSQSMNGMLSPSPGGKGGGGMPAHLFGDLESLALSPRLPPDGGVGGFRRMPALDQSWPGLNNGPNSAGLSSTWNGDMLSQAIDDAQKDGSEVGSGSNIESTPARNISAPSFINSPIGGGGGGGAAQSPIPHLNLELDDRVLEENEAELLNSLLEEEEEDEDEDEDEEQDEEDLDEEGDGDGAGSVPRRLLSGSLRSPLMRDNSLGLMALEEEEEEEEEG